MRSSVALLAFIVLVTTVSPSPAERCIGPKDNSVAPSYGVDPINAADITWCDDFDTYCGANCGDCDTGEPTSTWPGYPPTPDNLCTDPMDASAGFFAKPYHWPNAAVSNPLGLSSSTPGNGPWEWAGWDNATGWLTGPYTLLYKGYRNTNQYHTFSLEPAITRRFPGMDVINGTDSNPLTLRFWMNAAEIPIDGWYLEVPCNLAMYVELRMADDHAPTDYVLRNCSPEAQGPYPMICQQRVIPTGCPTTLSPTVHSSLAFGWLSTLDTNPCDVENGRKPTNYHAAIFDGNRWTQLFDSVFAGQVGKFNWDYGQAYFEMKVKTNVAEIKLIAYKDLGGYNWGLLTSTATVPRQYKGPFNRISLGVAPGCQLDAAGVCTGPPDGWRYMMNAPLSQNWGWADNYVDRVTLLGGIGASMKGACCMPDTSCASVFQSECLSQGGRWTAVGQSCESAACCAEAFGDADNDGAVDMNDFGALQRCLTGESVAGTGRCLCFDANGDGSVAGPADLDRFSDCANGPAIPADASGPCRGIGW